MIPTLQLGQTGRGLGTVVGESNVILLAHLDGANGSTTFLDSSPYARSLTRSLASAVISTAQSKFGGASLTGVNTGDYVFAAANANMNFNTDDFTVEAWIYPTSIPTSGQYMGIVGRRSGSSSQQWSFLVNGDQAGKIGFELANSLNTPFAVAYSASAPSANTWSHVAAVRQGDTLTVYLNGVGGTPVSLTGHTAATGLYNLALGRMSLAAAGYFIGHIDEVRVTKKFAWYTADFTPPTEPFPTPV